jgi:hypothetical protein
MATPDSDAGPPGQVAHDAAVAATEVFLERCGSMLPEEFRKEIANELYGIAHAEAEAVSAFVQRRLLQPSVN